MHKRTVDRKLSWRTEAHQANRTGRIIWRREELGSVRRVRGINLTVNLAWDEVRMMY